MATIGIAHQESQNQPRPPVQVLLFLHRASVNHMVIIGIAHWVFTSRSYLLGLSRLRRRLPGNASHMATTDIACRASQSPKRPLYQGLLLRLAAGSRMVIIGIAYLVFRSLLSLLT
jgi:hypothetical protein